jgi:cytochrome c biogenesis protein CcmG, thiol:disulfide interchange protein DsbE
MKKTVLLMIMIACQLSFAKIAPSFQGELLGGGKTSLAKQLAETKRSNHALILSFWATWCSPCIAELKSITDKIQTDKTLGLDVLTINVDTSETSSDVKPTVKLYKLDLPIILDPQHEIFSKYQDSKTLPFSVLISSKGEIVTTFSGYNEEMFTAVRKLTEAKPEIKNEAK